jgi:hypothetical protein
VGRNGFGGNEILLICVYPCPSVGQKLFYFAHRWTQMDTDRNFDLNRMRPVIGGDDEAGEMARPAGALACLAF